MNATRKDGLNMREILDKLVNGRNTPQKIVMRAKIAIRVREGIPKKRIAEELNISRTTVYLWAERYEQRGVAVLLKDAPRPGRIPLITAEKEKEVVEATLHTPPPNMTHWSVRTMATAQSISRMAVQRIWKKYNIQPHRIKTFKLSNDLQFIEKVRDVVGLYLNPPEKALMLSVDEKSQIQALDRTQPGLPLRKGYAGTMTHDYKRHGTTTLFAALNVLDGKVIGICMPKHRQDEFLKFLKKIDAETPDGIDLHLVVDNYGSHKIKRVKEWLTKHPRFHLHFTPTSASWLNIVERFFSEITTKKIRRGVFKSVQALIDAIMNFVENHNENPKIFTWTKDADTILAKVAKCTEALGTGH
jgi:transposase